MPPRTAADQVRSRRLSDVSNASFRFQHAAAVRDRLSSVPRVSIPRSRHAHLSTVSAVRSTCDSLTRGVGRRYWANLSLSEFICVIIVTVLGGLILLAVLGFLLLALYLSLCQRRQKRAADAPQSFVNPAAGQAPPAFSISSKA